MRLPDAASMQVKAMLQFSSSLVQIWIRVRLLFWVFHDSMFGCSFGWVPGLLSSCYATPDVGHFVGSITLLIFPHRFFTTLHLFLALRFFLLRRPLTTFRNALWSFFTFSGSLEARSTCSFGSAYRGWGGWGQFCWSKVSKVFFKKLLNRGIVKI